MLRLPEDKIQMRRSGDKKVSKMMKEIGIPLRTLENKGMCYELGETITYFGTDAQIVVLETKLNEVISYIKWVEGKIK